MEENLSNNKNNQEIIEFPDALFTPSERKMLKNTELSEKEQELFQLLMWYGHECDSYIYSYREILKPYNLRNIPYEYLKKEGFVQTVKRIDDLKMKIPIEMIIVIYDFIKTHPEKLFSVKNMSPHDFLYAKDIFTFQKYKEIKTDRAQSSIRYVRCIEKGYPLPKDRYFCDNDDDLPSLEISIGWIKADIESETVEVTKKGRKMLDWMDKYIEN